MTIGSDKANDKGTTSVSGKTEFEVEMDNFYFKPTVLMGTPGQQLPPTALEGAVQLGEETQRRWREHLVVPVVAGPGHD